MICYENILSLAVSFSLAYFLNYILTYFYLFSIIFPNRIKDFLAGMIHPIGLSILLALVYSISSFFVFHSTFLYSLIMKLTIALIVISLYYRAIGFSPKHLFNK